MSHTVHFEPPAGVDGEPFDVELTDEQAAWIEAYRQTHQLTLDQFFERVISQFVGTHPIIAQTRTPQ